MIDILDTIHLTIAQELEDFIDDLKQTINAQRDQITELTTKLNRADHITPGIMIPPKNNIGKLNIDVTPGLPIPQPLMPIRKDGPNSIYPFADLNISDSFFIPDDGEIKKQNAVTASAARFKPKRFTSRTVSENGVRGVRCWRIEELPNH